MKPLNLSLKLSMLFIFTQLLIACGPPSGAGKSSDATKLQVDSFSSLQQTIFTPRCAGCHLGSEAAAGIDLASYASIMKVPGLVTPGSPTASLLYTVVENGSMPKGSGRLTATQIESIAAWIEAGALDDTNNIPVPTPSPTPQEPPAETPPDDGTESPAPITFAQIQTAIFNNSCVRCHSGENPAKDLDLTTYEKLMAAQSGVLTPGSAQTSLLFIEVAGGTMPPRGAKVSPENIELLKNWINQGAKK